VPLDVEAVLQAQRPELVVGQFAGQVALHLVAILRNALQHQRVIVSVVAIHKSVSSCAGTVLHCRLSARFQPRRLRLSLPPIPNSMVASMAAGTAPAALPQAGCPADARQRADEQGAEQRPIDIAQPPVTQAGHQRERHRMGDVAADNANGRQTRVKVNSTAVPSAPAPTEEMVTSAPSRRRCLPSAAQMACRAIADARALSAMACRRLRKMSAHAVSSRAMPSDTADQR
jgi:hypothetical protein